MTVYNPNLSQLRSSRTRASNQVRRIMASCINDPAPFLLSNGLPSWWPFWSDVLVSAVRDACRGARLLEAAEAKEEAHAP